MDGVHIGSPQAQRRLFVHHIRRRIVLKPAPRGDDRLNMVFETLTTFPRCGPADVSIAATEL
jgi:hypothetical protein